MSSFTGYSDEKVPVRHRWEKRVVHLQVPTHWGSRELVGAWEPVLVNPAGSRYPWGFECAGCHRKVSSVCFAGATCMERPFCRKCRGAVDQNKEQALRSRASHALQRNDIALSDVPAMSDDELLEIENVGPKTVDMMRQLAAA